MTCSLDFVDSIAEEPTIRLSLADGATWILNRQETDFSPPPLREAVAQTLLADGGVVSASAYSFRTIRLGLYLGTATADATAAALQSLYRELDRPGNILRWWEHTTHPVFFRTFRASASSVRRLGFADGRRKKIEVELRAEYAGYGLLETPVSGVTVSTDPAAGSNGCFVDVTGVKGDVESPAIILWPSSAVNLGRHTMIASRRRGTPANAPFPLQAEAMTQGTDTTTQANDANFSGSGNNYSRCTFATATMQTRLSVTTVGTSGVDLRGTYRVLLRYRKNTSTDAINLQLRWGDASIADTLLTQNDVYSTAGSGSIVTADLGLITIPAGFDPVSDASGVELPVSNALKLQLRAERTSGAGTIDFDVLLLVPADDRLAILNWTRAAADFILDARDNSAHARDGSSQVLSAKSPPIVGGFPMLTPNQANRIYMLRVVSTDQSWTLTTYTVSVSYYPRYLTVRPAST
jgi:hypothetical protein